MAGYDLIGLLVGSEGTLAIITQITLKLIPKPPATLDGISAFNSTQDALNALSAVIQSGIHPSTAEFMTDTCMNAAIDYMGIDPMIPIRRAAIIWQVDGQTNADCQSQMDKIESLAKEPTFRSWGLKNYPIMCGVFDATYRWVLSKWRVKNTRKTLLCPWPRCLM